MLKVFRANINVWPWKDILVLKIYTATAHLPLPLVFCVCLRADCGQLKPAHSQWVARPDKLLFDV